MSTALNMVIKRGNINSEVCNCPLPTNAWKCTNTSSTQENKLKQEIQTLEQEIARLENNPDKKIKAVVS